MRGFFSISNRAKDRKDRKHCGTTLAQGHWLPSPDPLLHGQKSYVWDSPGCLIHPYRKSDVDECFKASKIVLIGDSTVRQLYWALFRKIKGRLDEEGKQGSPVHTSLLFLPSSGASLEFLWDPFLNNTDLSPHARAAATTQSTSKLLHNASLVIVGGGLWHAKHLGDSYLQQFEGSVEKIVYNMCLNETPLGKLDNGLTMTGESKKLLLFTPVPDPSYAKLNESHAHGLTPDRINLLNEALKRRSETSELHVAWSHSLMARHREDAYDTSGVHVTDIVADRMVDVLLNVKCNTALSIKKRYPKDNTCCQEYVHSAGTLLSLLLLSLTVLFGSALQFMDPNKIQRITKWNILRKASYLLPREAVRAISILFCAVAHCFLSDRSHLWNKTQKSHSVDGFISLCSLCFLVGIFTWRLSASRLIKPRPLSEDRISSFMSRIQTDEWKGWMQSTILIYHYFGVSHILWIYKIVRVLVASYVFMTGYGHTIFFYRKGDYSLTRLISVLLRVNILSCILSYAMNTDYMFYYFAPLVSFWYIVIFATMAICRSRNGNTLFLLCKIFVTAILTTTIINDTTLFDPLFQFFAQSARIHVELKEWRFRLRLDCLAVYSGMLFGLIHAKVQETGRHLTAEGMQIITERIKRSMLLVLALTVIFYIPLFLQTITKEAYNQWHPYLSPLPIMTFFILRNSSEFLRSRYSSAFARLGRCSLETFTLQFHIWLAADTKGLLSTGLFKGGPSLYHWGHKVEFIVLTMIFLLASEEVAQATQIITDWIVNVKVQSGARMKDENGHPLIKIDDNQRADEVDQKDNLGAAETGSSFIRERTFSRIWKQIVSSLQGRVFLILFPLWLWNVLRREGNV